MENLSHEIDNYLLKNARSNNCQYCLYSPDYKFKLYIKRVDGISFSVTLHRNNSRVFLRYITSLNELNNLFYCLTDTYLT